LLKLANIWAWLFR